MPRSIERSNIQWPTVAVAVAIYGGWLAATARHDAVPWPVLVAIGGWLLAWHGSLQHETIHGHPTRYPAINAVIGFVPLSLWLPYGSYHRSHRAHHAAAVITDPSHDPESRYRARTDGVAALLGWLQSTLAGQMIFGPPISVLRFLSGEARGVAREPVRVLRDWVPHLAAVAILIAWLDHVGLGLGRYILTFVYPGMALTMLRSYAEHRADLASPGLAASVEPIWRAPALRRASNAAVCWGCYSSTTTCTLHTTNPRRSPGIGCRIIMRAIGCGSSIWGRRSTAGMARSFGGSRCGRMTT